jgi:hypothetical protein
MCLNFEGLQKIMLNCCDPLSSVSVWNFSFFKTKVYQYHCISVSAKQYFNFPPFISFAKRGLDHFFQYFKKQQF